MPPSSCPSLLLPAYFSFWPVRFCLFCTHLHPNPVAPRREAKVCWPLTMHCELSKALTC